MSDAQFIALLITAVVSTVGGIVFMYLRGEKTHKRYNDLLNENYIDHKKVIVKLSEDITKAYVDNAKSQEHLANAIDDLKMVVYNKKGK